MRRERWRRALDLAVDATRVDRLGRTTDVLAFVVAQVFGAADRPAPPRRRRRTTRSPRPVTSTADCTWRPLASEAASPADRRPRRCSGRSCPNCEAFVYHKRLKRNLGVCPECNHHFRLPVRERLELLLDAGSFDDLSGDLEPLDPLGFADSKPYSQRIEEAQRKTGNREGVRLRHRDCRRAAARRRGHGLRLHRRQHGERRRRGDHARRRAGAGAAASPCSSSAPPAARACRRAASRSCRWRRRARRSRDCTRRASCSICLLTDPTYGGVSASFATLGDVLIAEPGAYIGFAGPKVIEQTIRQQLPDGFQTAEFLLEHGMLDLVSAREKTCACSCAKLLELHATPGRRGLSPETDGGRADHRSGCARAASAIPGSRPARPPRDRPNTLEYIGYVFDDFQELHGDRLFREDAAIVGGLARLGDLSVIVDRPPEGPHDQRDDGAQLRDAEPRGLPQGACA